MFRKPGQVLQPSLPIDYAETATIYESTVGKGVRSLLLTSAVPGEGVSTIAFGLAQHVAAVGKRVLFVDLNTHNSFAGNNLALPRHAWDMGEVLDEGRVFSIPERRLDILAAPAQGTFSVSRRSIEAVAETVRSWSAAYDIVIADAPCLTKPNSSGVPTPVLAACFDGVGLVVASGETARDAVSQGVNRLAEQGAALHSVILNDRATPSFRAEVDRQFRKWGAFGRVLRRFLWAPFAALQVFDEGY